MDDKPEPLASGDASTGSSVPDAFSTSPPEPGTIPETGIAAAAQGTGDAQYIPGSAYECKDSDLNHDPQPGDNPQPSNTAKEAGGKFTMPRLQ